MNRSTLVALQALPIHIALFDDTGGAGGAAGGDGGAGGSGDGGSGGGNQGGNGGAGGRQRDGRGRFAVPESDDPVILRNALHDAAREIEGANGRIHELNGENLKRRNELKDARTELGNISQRQSLVDQRAIRTEARIALTQAGAIDDDVVDLFLKNAGDTIKIDEKTGDVIGVTAALETFKTAKPKFFAPADAGNGGGGEGSGADGAAGGAAGGADGANGGAGGEGDARGNATGGAASPPGGGNGGGGSFKVANFRDPKVDPDKAMDLYMKTLR